MPGRPASAAQVIVYIIFFGLGKSLRRVLQIWLSRNRGISGPLSIPFDSFSSSFITALLTQVTAQPARPSQRVTSGSLQCHIHLTTA
jgi:hypothetical protein